MAPGVIPLIVIVVVLRLLAPAAAGAAVLPSPQGPSARNEAPVLPLGTPKPKPKPVPAPAPSEHYAEPEENAPLWRI